MCKLVCWPHYACGGLLVNMLTDTMSPVGDNGGIQSPNHSLGKIGDSDTVFDDYDPNIFLKKIHNYIDSNIWIGTHCWPQKLPLELFDEVIVVTTCTYRSKIYRWSRAYHHYFKPQWTNLSGMMLIDKMRIMAKNYLIPFRYVKGNNVKNIEFSDIVEQTPEFSYIINKPVDKHIARWKEVNYFLYEDLWNSTEARRFYEAEVECEFDRYYRYQ